MPTPQQIKTFLVMLRKALSASNYQFSEAEARECLQSVTPVINWLSYLAAYKERGVERRNAETPITEEVSRRSNP